MFGKGGMGTVYLATDERKIEAQDKNPYIAFKVLNENFKRHPQAFIALQREALWLRQHVRRQSLIIQSLQGGAPDVHISVVSDSGAVRSPR